MAELLQLRGVGHHAGPRLLFRDLDLVIGDRDRMSLIGPNGAGKSTLLGFLEGRELPMEGTRTVRKNLRVAYLEQQPALDPSRSALDEVLRRLQLSPGPPPGVDAEVAARAALQRAGFDDPTRPIAELSGGWARRVAAVAALASDPDLLLLDEPTNHLDLEGIEWLETTLARFPRALIVISHDRRFLEAVSTRVLEIDAAYSDGWLMEVGSYSHFLERREFVRSSQRQAADKLAAQVREDIRYLRQGPKARTSKSASRVARAHSNIDDLEELGRRNRKHEVEGAFRGTGRRSKRLLTAETITLHRGDRQLLESADFVLSPGSRMGLVGPNGCGKSSLLLAILGELPLEAGELRQAPDLKIVYFDQKRAQLDENSTIAKTLAPKGDTVLVRGRSMHIKSWTRQLGFRDDQVEQPIRSLSGGERARVLMGRLMAEEADVLLLDEPTNDLDLATLEMLEQSLLEFEGAVVLVTHDRFLLDRVCTSLFALDGKGSWAELADRQQWESWKRPVEDSKPRATPSQPQTHASKSAPRKKLSYKEQREFDGLETRILEAEQALESLQAELGDPAVMADAAAMAEVGRRAVDAQEQIDAMYARWSELEEKQGAGQ